jgi:2-polyprenyl-6-methoxyphenol hydroxylase-like FAD-dependent oxidoreductase
MSDRDLNQPVDLLVLGGGMAGLVAAARAAQAGASVALVEKAPRTGGSAVYAGFMWTAPTLEVMREINPGGDPVLAERLVEGYPAAMDWVHSLGVDARSPVTVLGYGRGSQTDMPQLLAACERIIRDARGGEVLLDAQARALDDLGTPIPGLLAAGADSGGLWFRAYAGGIATALVFGLQAAETALTTAGSSSAPLASSRSTS